MATSDRAVDAADMPLPSPAPGPIPTGTITSLSRWVLAHRRLVIVVWLIVFIAGAAGSGSVSKRLSFDFSLPGQPGYETAKKIAQAVRQRR